MKKYSLLILAFSTAFSLTSCLKDKNIEDQKYGMAGVEDIQLVEFGFKGSTTSPAGAIYPVFTPTTLESVPSVKFTVPVNYAGADVAPQDITLEIAVDPTLVTTYNAEQGSAYNALAANAYTIPATVVIPKGQRTATFEVTVRPTVFDASKENVLPIYIKSSSLGTISGNYGKAILSLPVKSIWEGTYTSVTQNNYGTLDANIGTAPYTQKDVVLTTVGPNRVRTQYVAQTYSGYTEYQFSGDNTTITKVNAFSGSLRATSIDQIVEIDPGKVFEIRWTFLGRGIRERYVRQ